MTPLPFTKVQSIGNDFVLLLEDNLHGADPQSLAIQLCRRHFAIGSDGLLVLGRAEDHLRLRMFNPDGSEDFCGNGLRCASNRALELGWVTGPTFAIFHLDRMVHVETFQDGTIRTEIGSATLDPEHVPIATGVGPIDGRTVSLDGESFVLTSLSTGSTHTVIFVDALPEDERFRRVSALLEHHPWFPERTSVLWTHIESNDLVRIRIWERGVGETLGCGTGSAAAAYAALRALGRSGAISVESRGGTLLAEIPDLNGPIMLRGRAFTVFEGVWLGA